LNTHQVLPIIVATRIQIDRGCRASGQDPDCSLSCDSGTVEVIGEIQIYRHRARVGRIQIANCSSSSSSWTRARVEVIGRIQICRCRRARVGRIQIAEARRRRARVEVDSGLLHGKTTE
jgi:hypothetical protein